VPFENSARSVDIWSCGCVLGELFMKRPLFQADKETAQLEAISKVCGAPSPALWPEVIDLRFFHTIKPKKNYRRRVREEYQLLPPKALDLLDAMLTLDPKRRITAENSLKSDWLKGFNKALVKPPDLPKHQDCHEMWSKRKRRGERYALHQPAQNQQNNEHDSNNELSQCKKFLEQNPTMTIAELARISGTAPEQLEMNAEFANVKVKDIFQTLEVSTCYVLLEYFVKSELFLKERSIFYLTLIKKMKMF